MPSHFRYEDTRRFRPACLSKGMITVGPVTTMMAPNTRATGQLKPAI